MGSRLDLQTLFEQILGNDHVYFQPPESVRMQYPAIRYSLAQIDLLHANDSIYQATKAYEVILIDEDPESIFADAILAISHCKFDRQYYSDNLNHFVYTIYY